MQHASQPERPFVYYLSNANYHDDWLEYGICDRRILLLCHQACYSRASNYLNWRHTFYVKVLVREWDALDDLLKYLIRGGMVDTPDISQRASIYLRFVDNITLVD